MGHLKKTILKENPVAFANVDPFELILWKVCGFLRFDQVLGYIPPSQACGIYHDRQEPYAESDSMPISRRRRVARGRYIVGHFPSS